MLKKGWLILVTMMFMVPFQIMVSAEEYSPHYLPGGKNYLCVDNFEFDVDQITTLFPFAVKPNAFYTLSVPRDFFDPGEISGSMSFLTNDTVIQSRSFHISEFEFQTSVPYYAYLTFQMPATANYMTLTFGENNDYLFTNNVHGIILEEGTTFSGYEDYIQGNLVDINGPYYQGEGVVIVNVDDPYTLEEITGQVRVVDAIDGDVSTNLTIVNDGYTVNKGVVGTYPITYSVTDTSGNETTFSISIKVVDITHPVMSGPTEIKVIYPNTLTLEAIRSQLHASDNVDGDISESIVQKSENYLVNSSMLGVYEALFSITDSSNNTTEYTVEIQVVDQTKPCFTGPDQFTIGYDSNLSIDDITASQTVMDDYDLDLSTQIVVSNDQFTANRREIGLYPVVLTVVDSSGNVMDKTIEIQVTDSIGPVVYLDTSIIMIYNESILSLSDFTGILIQSGELSSEETYHIQSVFDSYSDHAHEPGVYHLKLEYRDSSGNIALSKAFEVVVHEKNNYDQIPLPNPDIIEEKHEQSFIQKYWPYLAGGGILLVALISNIIWVIAYRKK